MLADESIDGNALARKHEWKALKKKIRKVHLKRTETDFSECRFSKTTALDLLAVELRSQILKDPKEACDEYCKDKYNMHRFRLHSFVTPSRYVSFMVYDGYHDYCAFYSNDLKRARPLG